LVVMTSIRPSVASAPLKAFSIEESEMVCLPLLWLSSARAPAYRSARIFELFEIREYRRIESNSNLDFRASNLGAIRFVKFANFEQVREPIPGFLR
jgi:hypothetical protein